MTNMSLEIYSPIDLEITNMDVINLGPDVAINMDTDQLDKIIWKV